VEVTCQEPFVRPPRIATSTTLHQMPGCAEHRQKNGPLLRATRIE